ncbi:membrane dipeptidase [Candidatus Bathyarchaeota archaeon]|nr:membrane dipeptidase [Candidatus Bathyarchaeota archaeon]
MFDLTKDQIERAKSIHHSSLVVDTHNDTILHVITSPPFVTSGNGAPVPRRSLGEKSEHGQIDIPRTQMGGVDCLLFAMYVSPLYSSRLLRLVQMLDTFNIEVENNLDTISIATSYDEISKTVKNGKIAAVITVEGGEPLEGKIESLRTIYRLGARSLTLTHFPRNDLGDGSGADSGSHLTDFGKEVVVEMNKLGMIVDISHLNPMGFWDVMDISKDPVLATHSNCKALCSHHRNLDDDQIKAMAEKGGVINLSFCAGFIKDGVGFGNPETLKKVTILDWLDHLDHAVELVGTKHVGIGSDLDGGCGFPGLDDITKFPDLTQGMVYRGYSDQDIGKILGGNNMRVFKKILT